MTEPGATCFHCAQPWAGASASSAQPITVEGETRWVCCPGCAAAAQLIDAAGLADYYRWRTAPGARPDTTESERWRAFDDAVVSGTDGRASVDLLMEGMRCSACAWLIEQQVARVGGVEECHVNPATHRARVRFRPGERALSEILAGIAALGYTPHVLGAADSLEVATRERRTALKRLVVAGFGMMQVMMIAVALYAGSFHGIEPVVRTYLRVISLIIATPVVFYSGWPLVRGALRALLARHLSLDLPIAMGILSAYLLSVADTLRASGEVYFDSVTMFVFLLLLGRYLEMVARHRAGSTTDALARMLPSTAARLARDGTVEYVASAALRAGDTVRVASGGAFPADGTLIDQDARVDESLLTGESAAIVRRAGERLIGGTVNCGGPVHVRVEALGESTVLASIIRLLERAQTERPRLGRLADRVAGGFLGAVFVAAVIAAVGWACVDPSRAYPAVLAVLVVACPCALSLATPVALAAASTALARHGVLVTRADAIEALATVDQAVFDKTGTLTCGQPRVTSVHAPAGRSAAECLAIAAALERDCAHPVARAFAGPGDAVATDVVEIAGAGIEGTCAGRRWRIGKAEFVAPMAGPRPPGWRDDGIHLGHDGAWVAAFSVSDPLRPGAPGAVGALASRHIGARILSGDHAYAVAGVARAVGIAHWTARATPGDKLAELGALAARGARVMMIGDGVNDAPSMRAASVSVAVGSGCALAQASADIVLVGDDLAALADAVDVARRTLSIVRQNLAWACAYNALTLPAAALGWLPPWAAALGMSGSSLLVVLNALRLLRPRRRRTDQPAAAPASAVALA